MRAPELPGKGALTTGACYRGIGTFKFFLLIFFISYLFIPLCKVLGNFQFEILLFILALAKRKTVEVNC